MWKIESNEHGQAMLEKWQKHWTVPYIGKLCYPGYGLCIEDQICQIGFQHADEQEEICNERQHDLSGEKYTLITLR